MKNSPSCTCFIILNLSKCTLDEEVVEYPHLSLGKMRRCVKFTGKAIGVPFTYRYKLWIEMGRSIPLTKGTLR